MDSTLPVLQLQPVGVCLIYAKTLRQFECRKTDTVTLVLGLINARTDAKTLDVDIHTYIHLFASINIYNIKQQCN